MSDPATGPAPRVVTLTDHPVERKALIWALVATILRIAGGLGLIFLMMFLVPESPDGRLAAPIVIAIVGIVGYSWFFRRQIRGVYKSRFPNLRAAEALILVAAMFLAIFSMAYVVLSLTEPGSFTEPLTPFTGYYFALTVLATVGFGDITPVTMVARSITMVQMSLDLAFIAVIIKIMGGVARRAVEQRELRRRQGTDAASSPPRPPADS